MTPAITPQAGGDSNPFIDRAPGTYITAPRVGPTLDATIKPEPRLLRGNVILARAVFLTESVGRSLLGLSNDLNGRDTIDPGNIAEVRAKIANALASIEEVATAAAGDESGFLLDGADAYAAARLTTAKGN